MGWFFILLFFAVVAWFFFSFLTTPGGGTSQPSHSGDNASLSDWRAQPNAFTDGDSPLNIVTNPCDIYRDS